MPRFFKNLLESDKLIRVFCTGRLVHPVSIQLFGLAGGYDGACRFFNRLQVIRRAASLGGVESLCSLPILTSQYGFSDEQLAAAGVTRGMVRLSIGLEHPDDLIADLDQALN